MRAWLLVSLIVVPGIAFADGAAGSSDTLEHSYHVGQQAGAKIVQDEDIELEPNDSESAKSDRSAEIRRLLDSVDELKSQVVVTKRNALSLQRARQKRSIGSRTVFDYIDGNLYEVQAAVERVTDIELGEGERILSDPIAGDTVRWKVGVMVSGVGAEERTHLVVKPLEEAISTNLLISTNKRTYHLKLTSQDEYMPSVSWNYPTEEMAKLEEAYKRGLLQEPISVAPEKLNFDYSIESKRFKWAPREVFDDGSKTYLKMPRDLASGEAPVLFILDSEGEPMLTNYRVRGEFYVVDRLFDRAELRVGKNDTVEIASDRFEKSFWGSIF